jgi:hypothetical protein
MGIVSSAICPFGENVTGWKARSTSNAGATGRNRPIWLLHITATARLRNPTEGRLLRPKEASGKTSMEAMRRLSDIVYRHMGYCLLHDGNSDEAAAHPNQALVIYQTNWRPDMQPIQHARRGPVGG